jgi:bifunctional DNA-binding transcriptional regulator/antitoxin component of YhaV-PrlF toxin-antitoxin module
MKNKLHKTVILQEVRRGEVTQYSLTIPRDFVSLLGLVKGDELRITVVLGSGQIIIEKKDE